MHTHATGQVLHTLWAAQPGGAGGSPMPYAKAVKELLTDDPFWTMVHARDNPAVIHVKLNAAAIKSLLNF
jgi:hypothetical protein